MGNICFTKKYITFYKNTYESLEKQLECYISDEFNCDGNICGHNIIDDDSNSTLIGTNINWLLNLL